MFTKTLTHRVAPSSYICLPQMIFHIPYVASIFTLGYYHQVDSFGTHNVAVSILFSRFDNVVEYDNTGCDSSPFEFVPLSNLDVDWKYPGYGTMTMGYAELSAVRSVCAVKQLY